MIVLYSKQPELSTLNESALKSEYEHYGILARHYADLMLKTDKRHNYEQGEKYFDLYKQVSDKQHVALDSMINNINNTLGYSNIQKNIHLKIV